MKKSLLFVLGLTAVVLLSVISAFAQEVAPPADRAQVERAVVHTMQRVAPTAQGPEAKATTFYWMESEFSFDGKVVKGTPYSAEAVTETTQTLSDGNRIVNKSSTMLYRDSEGRTRREQNLNHISNLVSGPAIKTVMINDPIAGVTYSLDPESRTARKNNIFHYTLASKSPGATADIITTQNVAGGRARSGGADAPTPPVVTFKSNTGGTFTFNVQGDQKNISKESLGTQLVEGVEAEGTKVTVTIPAGAIGNERPINIVDERWYSPTLQTVVMTRHSDPRTGENVYRLTNIDRTEPARSLFEVPADYQVNQTKDFPAMTVFPEMRVRKPEQE